MRVTDASELVEETPYRWVLRRHGHMRVPGVVFASRSLLPDVAADRSLEQVRNVATLPGIVRASYAMPDVHWGYGFPIGGVAATDVAAGGVVSPGGVGFDISCGVRVLVSPLTVEDVGGRLQELLDALRAAVPSGMGPGGVWKVNDVQLRSVLLGGAREALAHGFGDERDLRRCEDGGVLAGADPDHVSSRSVERGKAQLGSLGSGNHFLEVQVVDRVDDPAAATAFGLSAKRICVMIHCGSRGLGHQVCSDHVRGMLDAMSRYDIEVPDPQLACAPVTSPEGRAYLRAMAAAANYGQANRQVLAAAVRKAFRRVTGIGDLEQLYDVSHNLAKLERHRIDAEPRLLCVHRKGATRALPPGDPALPEELRAVGQPVLVPGSMGTASYILTGHRNNTAFLSACHGAGRVMSRHAASRAIGGRQLQEQLRQAGIVVRGGSWRGLAEEAPFAYKDVDEVVRSCEGAELARVVARLRPIGVIKG